MKSSVKAPEIQTVSATVEVRLKERLSDLFELTKPRIAVMVILTVIVGQYLAYSVYQAPIAAAIYGLIGISLIAAGSSAFNHLLEKHSDRLMQRTENRPVASGRLSIWEASLFGGILVISGIVVLSIYSNPLTLVLGVTSHVVYCWIYTPLKRVTATNTIIGAVAGALPIAIGWTSVSGVWTTECSILFFILFIWQFPHFFAIAWLYRNDYRRGGIRMLPTADFGQSTIGFQTLSYSLVLIPLTYYTVSSTGTHVGYLMAVTILNLQFVGFSLAFCLNKTDQSARSLLRSSLIYLPGLMLLLTMA